MRSIKTLVVICSVAVLLVAGCGKMNKSKKVVKNDVKQNVEQVVAIQPFSFEFSGFNYKSWNIDPVKPGISAVETVLTAKLKQIKDKNVIKVIGYADRSGPENPEGSKMGNIALSLKRANAVVNYLSSRYGVSADLFRVEGLGSSELKNAQKPYDKVNRRVVVEYSK